MYSDPFSYSDEGKEYSLNPTLDWICTLTAADELEQYQIRLS